MAAFVTFGLPATAHGGNVTSGAVDGVPVVKYTAAQNEGNAVQIDMVAPGANAVVTITDRVPVTENGAHCQRRATTRVTCEIHPPRLEVSLGNDDDRFTLTSQLGGLVFDGGTGDDRVNVPTARRQADIIRGGADDDTLVGGVLARLEGGFGNDQFPQGPDPDFFLLGIAGGQDIIGGPGIDTVSYSQRLREVNVTLDGRANDGTAREEDDVRVDNVTGGGGDDTLTAPSGQFVTSEIANVFRGSGGDDVIGAGEGNDMLDGGTGDDTLTAGGGADVVIGGEGRDTARYSDKQVGVIVSPGGGANDGTDGNGDGVAEEGDNVAGDVEGSLGGSGSDRLFGDAGANTLHGGRAGRDLLVGAEGNDELQGGPDIDILQGGLGDDIVEGGLGADAMTGGDGRDTLTYRDRNAGVVVSVDGNANDGEAGEAESAPFDIEVLEGGNGDDVLTGRDQGPDVLRGARGDDRLLGLGGADELDGGAGENVLDGGSGGDRFRFGTVTYQNRTAPVIVITDNQANDGEAGEGDLVDQVPKVVGGSGDDVMTAGSSQQCACAISRDHFVGGPGADRLTGAEAGDVLEGGPGADRLDGGSGIDVVSYASEIRPVVADLDPAAGDDGADTDGDGDADEGDTIIAVEDLTGGAGADRLTGDASPNDLDGGPGADRLDGLDGDDFLAANDGVSDTLACGSGTFDFAIVDLQDVPPDFGDCERLNRAPLREHPMVEVSPQARLLRAGQLLRISLKCPAAAPRTCSGTLALRAATRSGRPRAALARARYSIRRRSSRRIDLRLPRALGRRMVAARPGAYVATADERAVDGRAKRARVPLTSP